MRNYSDYYYLLVVEVENLGERAEDDITPAC